MYTRENFVEDILYSMDEESIRRIFGIEFEELENNGWNANLEIAYQQMLE